MSESQAEATFLSACKSGVPRNAQCNQLWRPPIQAVEPRGLERSDFVPWRNRRLQPKTAFQRIPPVHRGDLQGQLRVYSVEKVGNWGTAKILLPRA
jgi:hypothetical protein